MATVGKYIASSKRNSDGSVSYTYKDGSSATIGGSGNKSGTSGYSSYVPGTTRGSDAQKSGTPVGYNYSGVSGGSGTKTTSTSGTKTTPTDIKTTTTDIKTTLPTSGVDTDKVLGTAAGIAGNTYSDNMNRAIADWNNAKAKGTAIGGAVWDASNKDEFRDTFNDYNTYNSVYNKYAKQYNLTPEEAQMLGNMITKDSGSNATLRKKAQEGGYYTDPSLSNSGNLAYFNAQEAYDAAAEAQKLAAQQEYDANIAAIAEQERLAQQRAEEANRLAYIQEVLGKRNLSQELTAQGINGGATESALLQLAANYGNQVSSNNNALNSALYGYGNDRVNAAGSYNSAVAQANANRAANINQTLLDLLKNESKNTTEQAIAYDELYNNGVTGYNDFYNQTKDNFTRDEIDKMYKSYENYFKSAETSRYQSNYDDIVSNIKANKYSKRQLKQMIKDAADPENDLITEDQMNQLIKKYC